MNNPGRNATRLSAAMMVRDEEANLERCLSAIRDVVDEIIVVDTGSKDRTVEIARSFGAVVYNHPWENDFSKHRNQSIGYCSGDWILVIDADEELVVPPGFDLKRALGDVGKTHDTAAVMLVNYNQGEAVSQLLHPRFFKRGTVAYHGRVHNRIVGEPDCILLPGIELKHYGYDRESPVRMKKFERSKALMEEVLRETPTDYQMLMQISELYADYGFYDEAIKYGDQYISFREKIGKGFNPTIFFTLANIAIEEKKDPGLARKYILEGSRAFPDYLDIWFVGIKLGNMVVDHRLAQNCAHEYIRLFERYQKDPSLMGMKFIHTYGPKYVAFAAYTLAAAGLYQASAAFEVIHNVLPMLDDDYRKKLVDQVMTVVPQMRLPAQVTVVPLLDPEKPVEYRMEGIGGARC